MAGDQSILDLIFRIRKAGTGAGDAVADVKKLQKANKEFKNEVKEMAAGAAAGIAVLAGAYAATVAPTLAYAGAVRDLGRNIGATAEESSKLIQAADDVGLSSEDLEKALKAAITKGVKPTIENIGKLADEYVSIQDPIAKSEFLIDKFGKSGLDMGKLLEQGSKGIKAAGDEAAAMGLVLSGQDVKAARELEIAFDNLQDVVQGLQISVGMQLIPVLTAAAGSLQTLLTWNMRIKAAVDEHKASVLANSESYAAYVAEMERVSEVSGGVNGIFTGLIEKQNILSESAYNAAHAAAQVTDYYHGVETATNSAAGALDTASTATTGLSTETATLAQRIKDVQKAQQAWGESTATDIQAALESAGVTGAEYNAALTVIDSTLGTSKVQQDQYQQKVKAITDEFKKTGDVKAFREQIEALKNQFSPAAVEAQKAADSTKNLNDQLAILQDKTVTITVNYVTNGTPPAGVGAPPSDNAPGNNNNRRQAGGTIINERGGELFMPASSVGSVMNNNDMRRLIAALEKIAGGGGLNMTINTAAQPNIGGLASQARAVAGAFR